MTTDEKPSENDDAERDESGDGLTPRQRIAVSALAIGKLVHEAATLAGVDRRTLSEWKKDRRFREAVRRESYEFSTSLVTQVLGLVTGAMQTLDDVRRNPDAKPFEKISAARSIAELGTRLMVERIRAESREGGGDQETVEETAARIQKALREMETATYGKCQDCGRGWHPPTMTCDDARKNGVAIG